MTYFYIILGLIISAPFCLIVTGFALSFTKSTKKAVTARYNIAYALDTLGAACFLFGHKTTISGWAGYKSVKSNKKRWTILVKLIDSLPWFYTGHCDEAAVNEAAYNGLTI